MSATDDNAHCFILPGSEPRVQHFDCDTYKDGVITNPLTGDIVSVPATQPEFTPEILGDFIEDLQRATTEYFARRWPSLIANRISVEAGRRFTRIIETNVNNDGTAGQRGVHAFVENATGNLIKAATWAAPQKSTVDPTGFAVRFNLATPAGRAAAIDAYRAKGGSYLYK